jgi:2-polyprenyl-3-methyl-5-hydroxy-6-metoxy-1,4-benzoquinol methylase
MSPVSVPENVEIIGGTREDHRDYPAEAGVMRSLAEAEDRHFWHADRNAFIVDRLMRPGFLPGTSVLDIGCGAGSVAAAMSRVGLAVTGVDGHLSRVILAAKRAPESRFIVHDLTQGLSPVQGQSFDAALMFDVIEHLDDPVGALTEALSCVREGGVVAGTVPALMSLWSDVDVQSGHKLRYSIDALTQTLKAVPGVSEIEIVPFFRHLIPLMWVQRRLLLRRKGRVVEENLAIPGFGLNRVLRLGGWMERTLAPVLDRVPLPGASLWFALRKQPQVSARDGEVSALEQPEPSPRRPTAAQRAGVAAHP